MPRDTLTMLPRRSTLQAHQVDGEGQANTTYTPVVVAFAVSALFLCGVVCVCGFECV